MKFTVYGIQTFPSHLKHVAALPCEMQTFENDTNYAEIAIKSYYVEASDTLNQILTFTRFDQNILL